MHFDRPFLLYLREARATRPYFVLWVGNAELLQLQPEPALPDQLRHMLDDASNGLTAAVNHVARLQQAAHGAGEGAPPGQPGSAAQPGG